MTVHYLGGVSIQMGGLYAYARCHPQLKLYEGDELTTDPDRVHCSSCRKALEPPPPYIPYDEMWVCEGQERIKAELENAAKASVVDTQLTKENHGIPIGP